MQTRWSDCPCDAIRYTRTSLISLCASQMGKAKAAAQPKRGGKGSALLLDLAMEDEHQQGLALLGHTEKAKAGAKRATSVGDIRADLNDKVKELMKARLRRGARALGVGR